MSGRYAEKTSVGVDKSKAEIERTLDRYGATAFMYGRDGARVTIGFRVEGRMVRMELPMPDSEDRAFHVTDKGRKRTREAAHKEWEQACRQRWRALALVIKAKLEAVESGISTIEREFLADIMLPDGTTVGRWSERQIASAYETGKMPPMLPGGDQ
jgi:hypothetical protein